MDSSLPAPSWTMRCRERQTDRHSCSRRITCPARPIRWASKGRARPARSVPARRSLTQSLTACGANTRSITLTCRRRPSGSGSRSASINDAIAYDLDPWGNKWQRAMFYCLHGRGLRKRCSRLCLELLDETENWLMIRTIVVVAMLLLGAGAVMAQQEIAVKQDNLMR